MIPPKNNSPAGGKEAADLIRKSPIADRQEGRVEQVPVDKIDPNPHQPRQRFEQGQLDELMESIRTHGIIQPLVVTKTDGGYELIAGERRLRAAKFLNLKTVPVIVRQAAEREKLELSLIENIQRENLNPIEVALAYQRLIDEFNFSLEEVGHKVGKAANSVINQLRLLNLPRPMQETLIDGRLATGHGKVLAGVDDPRAQEKLFKQILSEQLNVREAEMAAQRRPGKKYLRTKDANLLSREEALQKALGTKVQIDQKREGHGKIIIEFYSNEELAELIKKLT